MIPRVSFDRRCAAETRTGAALILLVVKVAAATAGKSETRSARSPRSDASGLMPLQTADARKPRGAVIPPSIFENPNSMLAKLRQIIRNCQSLRTTPANYSCRHVELKERVGTCSVPVLIHGRPKKERTRTRGHDRARKASALLRPCSGYSDPPDLATDPVRGRTARGKRILLRSRTRSSHFDGRPGEDRARDGEVIKENQLFERIVFSREEADRLARGGE